MTFPAINLEYSGMPADVYCPVCGQALYTQKEDATSCEHVVFSYLPDIGEFDYVASYLEAQVDSIMEQAEDDKDREPVDILLEQLDSTSILCFSITTSGVACGPTSSTVYVAVDFCPPVAED